MKKLIVANWKMQLDTHQSLEFIDYLIEYLTSSSINEYIFDTSKTDLVLCADFLSLSEMNVKITKNHLIRILKLGAQNCSSEDKGSLTGEVSPLNLSSMVSHVILGHSSRRQNLNETDKEISAKVAAARRNDLTPIVCIGENLKEKEANSSWDVVSSQLHAALHELVVSDVSNCIIAYEPIWAISTNQHIEPDYNEVGDIIQKIRLSLEQQYPGNMDKVRVLYGGSVNSKNLNLIIKDTGVDGVLVGGASTDPIEFGKMVKAIK